jgi:hypothetical protein
MFATAQSAVVLRGSIMIEGHQKSVNPLRFWIRIVESMRVGALEVKDTAV